MKPVEHRLKVLEELKSVVCKDRMADYSDAEYNFAHIAARWSLYLNQRFGINIKLGNHDVAALMMLGQRTDPAGDAEIGHNDGLGGSWLDEASGHRAEVHQGERVVRDARLVSRYLERDVAVGGQHDTIATLG